MARTTKLVLVVVAALLVATVGTVLIVHSMRTGDGGTPSAAPPATTTSRTAMTAGPSVTAAASDARVRMPVSEHRAHERTAMLAAIASARASRDNRSATPASPRLRPTAPSAAGDDSTATTLDIVDRTGDTSEWQKRALGTLNTLLGQCYDLGRTEDANLAGTVTVRFTLVGEPAVGGLLERVEIVDANTTISQATLRDCLTQQLYALELDPPPAGVTIERELSLQFP